MRKYPLQTLQKQREHAVNRDAVQLHQAEQLVDRASRVHEEAKTRHQQAVEHATGQRAKEGERVRRGRARASDLLQQAKHDVQTRLELAALQEAQANAEEHLQQARRASNERVDQLQHSAASAKATSEHRRRWEQEERKRRARREDESAHEAWQAGRSNAGRPGSGPAGSGSTGSGGP